MKHPSIHTSCPPRFAAAATHGASLSLLAWGLVALTGCSDPPRPVAVIASVDDALAGSMPDAGSTCDGRSTLQGSVGVAPAVSGACSHDSRGRELLFAWRLVDMPSGSLAALHDSTLATPTFIPDLPGDYALELEVTAGGRRSDPVRTVVTVDECGARPPSVGVIAVAPGANPATAQSVQLVPTVIDADTEASCAAHESTYEFTWTVVRRPAGSVALPNDAFVMAPSFVADEPGEYLLRVAVTDPTGRTGYGEVLVTAAACGSNVPSVLASASSTAVSVGEGVQVNAAVSDADNDGGCGANQTFDYRWEWVALPAGSAAQLTGDSARAASFVADAPGDYVLSVTTIDSTGRRSDPSLVTIGVDSCGLARPTVTAAKTAPGATVSCGTGALAVDLAGAGDEVQLTATATDADNSACGLDQRFDYRWELMSAPLQAGDARLEPSTGRATTLDTRGEDGTFQVRVIVTDETGRESDPAVCTVNVQNAN